MIRLVSAWDGEDRFERLGSERVKCIALALQHRPHHMWRFVYQQWHARLHGHASAKRPAHGASPPIPDELFMLGKLHLKLTDPIHGLTGTATKAAALRDGAGGERFSPQWASQCVCSGSFKVPGCCVLSRGKSTGVSHL